MSRFKTKDGEDHLCYDIECTKKMNIGDIGAFIDTMEIELELFNTSIKNMNELRDGLKAEIKFLTDIYNKKLKDGEKF